MVLSARSRKQGMARKLLKGLTRSERTDTIAQRGGNKRVREVRSAGSVHYAIT
jgi:hypothetical protein